MDADCEKAIFTEFEFCEKVLAQLGDAPTLSKTIREEEFITLMEGLRERAQIAHIRNDKLATISARGAFNVLRGAAKVSVDGVKALGSFSNLKMLPTPSLPTSIRQKLTKTVKSKDPLLPKSIRDIFQGEINSAFAKSNNQKKNMPKEEDGDTFISSRDATDKNHKVESIVLKRKNDEEFTLYYTKDEAGNVKLLADTADVNTMQQFKKNLNNLHEELREYKGAEQFHLKNMPNDGAIQKVKVLERITGYTKLDNNTLVRKGKGYSSMYTDMMELDILINTHLLQRAEGFVQMAQSVFCRKPKCIKQVMNEATKLNSDATIFMKYTDATYAAEIQTKTDILSKLKEVHGDVLAKLRATSICKAPPCDIEFKFSSRRDQAGGVNRIMSDSPNIEDSIRRQFEDYIKKGEPEPQIRIQPFEDLIEGAATPDLVKQLKEAELAVMNEMLDTDLNRTLDVTGKLRASEKKLGGEAFDIKRYLKKQEYVFELSKNKDKLYARAMDEAENYGSIQKRLSETGDLASAQKIVGMREGNAVAASMIFSVKKVPQTAKAMFESAKYLDGDDLIKAFGKRDRTFEQKQAFETAMSDREMLKEEVFGHLSKDIGIGERGKTWKDFSAKDYYQSAGSAVGRGFTVNGKKFDPKGTMTIAGFYKTKFKYKPNEPYLFKPDLDSFTEPCTKGSKFCVVSNEGSYLSDVNTRNLPSGKSEKLKSWLYPKTISNACKRYPKLCTAGFATAVGGGIYGTLEATSCNGMWSALGDEACAKPAKNYNDLNPAACASTICTKDQDPETDCCTTEARANCYRHCLPRNYRSNSEGSLPAVSVKRDSNTTISNWCLNKYADSDVPCQTHASNTTGSPIESSTKCMSYAQKYLKNDYGPEVEELGAYMAYPGVTSGDNGEDLPWVKDGEWIPNCQTPDYNTNDKMIEHMLYTKGCGSIKHNLRTKNDWSRQTFLNDTNLKLHVDCDLSAKDFEAFMAKDEGTWKTSIERGIFDDQPYCSKDEDDPIGSCRTWCHERCSTIDDDYENTYSTMMARAIKRDKKAADDKLTTFAMTAGIIGIGVVIILLFFGQSKGSSDEERMMRELEDKN